MLRGKMVSFSNIFCCCCFHSLDTRIVSLGFTSTSSRKLYFENQKGTVLMANICTKRKCLFFPNNFSLFSLVSLFVSLFRCFQGRRRTSTAAWALSGTWFPRSPRVKRTSHSEAPSWRRAMQHKRQLGVADGDVGFALSKSRNYVPESAQSAVDVLRLPWKQRKRETRENNEKLFGKNKHFRFVHLFVIKTVPFCGRGHASRTTMVDPKVYPRNKHASWKRFLRCFRESSPLRAHIQRTCSEEAPCLHHPTPLRRIECRWNLLPPEQPRVVISYSQGYCFDNK